MWQFQALCALLVIVCPATSQQFDLDVDVKGDGTFVVIHHILTIEECTPLWGEPERVQMAGHGAVAA